MLENFKKFMSSESFCACYFSCMTYLRYLNCVILYRQVFNFRAFAQEEPAGNLIFIVMRCFETATSVGLINSLKQYDIP